MNTPRHKLVRLAVDASKNLPADERADILEAAGSILPKGDLKTVCFKTAALLRQTEDHQLKLSQLLHDA